MSQHISSFIATKTQTLMADLIKSSLVMAMVAAVLVSTGCGQKGALYLPDSQSVLGSNSDSSAEQNETEMTPEEREQIERIISDPNDY